MRYNYLLFMIAIIVLFLTNCSNSTSPEIDLQRPSDFTINQIDLALFQLNWQDNSTNETGYKVERQFTYGPNEIIAILNENTESFIDDVPFQGQTGGNVTYRLYSYYSNEMSYPDYSYLEIDFPTPNNLYAANHNHSGDFDLFWTDNSEGEDGFIIEMKTNDGPFEQLAAVDSNTTMYSLINVDYENDYYFRVKAFVNTLTSHGSNIIQAYHYASPLVADFTSDYVTGDDPLDVYFYDLSTENAISWHWDFGNGTSYGQNISRTFQGGTYTVSLTVSNGVTESTTIKTDYIVVKYPNSFYQDGFEDYDNFAIEFAPWTLIDVDQAETYGLGSTTWPNVFAPQSFIIFNPSAAFPPLSGCYPNSGDKFAACFSAVEYDNNDWLISPQISIGSDNIVSFWVKSYTDQYELEKFTVGISPSNTVASGFTIISEGAYLEAPIYWMQYSYDLSEFEGQDMFIGIHCVSSNGFMLMIDDFEIGTNTSIN